jgi:hypothetical protein
MMLSLLMHHIFSKSIWRTCCWCNDLSHSRVVKIPPNLSWPFSPFP